MHGVDGDVTEGQVFVEILVGADVAAAAFEAHFDIELAAFADGGQVQVAVEHFDVLVGLNLGAHDFAGMIDGQVHGFHAVAHDLEGNLFEVKNDVGGVFDHAGDGAEFMLHALDADRRDGRAFDGAEEDAAQAIADGGAEAGLKRLGGKHAIPLGESFGIGNQSFRFLKALEHNLLLGVDTAHRGRAPLYFEYNSTISCSFN